MASQSRATEGIVSCANCGSVYRAHRAGSTCVNCGGELSGPKSPVDLTREPKFLGVFGFLKPVADSMDAGLREQNLLRSSGGASLAERIEGRVVCGWCRRQYTSRPPSPNCEQCGGVLPLPPGSDPGAPPPPPPRRLPGRFVWNLYVKQNVGGLFGLGAMLVSVPLLLTCIGLPLLLVGVIVAYSNFATAFRRHIALSRGIPVPGRIESVQRIGREEDTNHGSVLYRVYFRFDLGSEGLLGMKYTYDPAITDHFVGEPIWVVCLSKRPKYYDIWPPLA